jgi:cobalt-zinc-cadmium efflux system outer membrane protein
MSPIAAFRRTTRRSCLGFCLGALLLAPEVRAQTSNSLTEGELTLRVCRTGPAALTARAERALGASEVGAIEPLRNPVLVVEHQQTLRGFTDRETIVGAQVLLPISGRRGLLRDAAEARERASNARADADLLETALEFRAAFELAVLEHERVVVMQAQQKELEDLSSALKQLNAHGEAAAYDVRRHETELRLHGRALAAARVRAETTRRRLLRWLDEPLEPSLLRTAVLERRALPAARVNQHPEVLALRSTARAADLESDAARRRWVPEPEVFAGYRQIAQDDQTGHGLSLGLSLPLTFLDYGQGASARARAERALAEARAGRLERELDREVSAAGAGLPALEAALREAEQSVAAAEQLRQSARTLYEAGEASMTELLDAYRTSENAALDRLTALEELLGARLDLMRAAGKQFDPSLDASCANQGKTER